jgi:flagellar biosynthesis/type III secretory pathway protein FliH
MLMTEWNWDDALAVRYEEGMEQGREEGLEEGRMIIARNLLFKGCMPEFVQEITGLSMDEIAKL